MLVKDLPVVMLAAGMATRFRPEHRDVPKALLPISGNRVIFDLIREALIKSGVTKLFVILGHKAEKFQQKINHLPESNLLIYPIIANDDFVHGPAFTLLSLIPYISHIGKKIVIIPSDTLFHPIFLNKIFSTTIDESDDYCQLFVIPVSDEKFSQFNSPIPFQPRLLDKILAMNSDSNTASSKEYIIPILVLSNSFLTYISKAEIHLSGKIMDNLIKYIEFKDKCRISRIEYTESLPPFIDIDTSSVYNTLISLKKELFEAYKVK